MSLLQLAIDIEKIGPIQGDSSENLLPDSDQENKISCTPLQKRQPPKIPKEKRRIRFSAQKHVCYFSQDGAQSLTFSPITSPRQKSESLHSILKTKGVAQSWGGPK